MALFVLLDPTRAGVSPRPVRGSPLPSRLVVTAPHLVWLVQHDFAARIMRKSRAEPARGVIDHLLLPVAISRQPDRLLIPALLIAAPLLWPAPSRRRHGRAPNADAFDRRIVALLTFGPTLTLCLASLVSGRGTQSTWGYPLWLFLGLYIVMLAPAAFERTRLAHLGAHWAAVFVLFVAAFLADYLVLPNFDHRYRAAFFPGDALSEAITQRFEAATGKNPLTSSRRCGTAATSRIIRRGARSRGC